MSKIGNQPVKILEGVEVKLEDKKIQVTGPKGSLSIDIPRGINLDIKDGFVYLTSKDVSKSGRAKFGTTRALVANMVGGVLNGWTKQLELVGTGYRADVAGKALNLVVGYSHPIKVDAPEGIEFKVDKNIITISGANKELVGQMAANIRAFRPPEPYKGKGIKYVNELIRRKAGKAAKTAGAPA